MFQWQSLWFNFLYSLQISWYHSSFLRDDLKYEQHYYSIIKVSSATRASLPHFFLSNTHKPILCRKAGWCSSNNNNHRDGRDMAGRKRKCVYWRAAPTRGKWLFDGGNNDNSAWPRWLAGNKTSAARQCRLQPSWPPPFIPVSIEWKLMATTIIALLLPPSINAPYEATIKFSLRRPFSLRERERKEHSVYNEILRWNSNRARRFRMKFILNFILCCRELILERESGVSYLEWLRLRYLSNYRIEGKY